MTAPAIIQSALARFGIGLSQHARLLTLASAQESNLPESLMVEKFTGREAVNELFLFEIDALSVSTDIDLAVFIGEELTLTLLQPDASRRAWHGICTDAAWLGADGGMARYRLRLEPALALLRQRRDSYIFQDKTARDIITELLADYPQLRFDFDLTQTLETRPIRTQYRESDYDFFVRVMAAEGLSWRFEHAQEDENDSDAQAKHRLIIFDNQAQAPDTLGGDTLRFHGVRATDTDDAIDRFAALRQTTSNAVSINSWEPGQLQAPAAEQSTHLNNGQLPSMAVFDGSGERRLQDADAFESHSLRMLQALEMENKTFEGAGAVRRLAAGHAFSLSQHQNYGDGMNRFTVLWVNHTGRNNINMKNSGHNNAATADGTYRNRFGCVRNAVPILPHATARHSVATAPGPQSALVVGLPNAVSTTGRDHQIKIQFGWQRGANGNAGSQKHNTDAIGNAPGNDHSGTWVRVAEALSGPNWGSQFTPRIGTEVLISFIEGDIDRPVIVGQLYTGADAPPFAAGVDSGVNHAGVLSGIHSHNFDGSGFNQWQIDDTPGQLRTRLATSSAATQLNLGYLIRQAPVSAQRGTCRGTGFEFRTDGWAMLRAAEGMLISSSARPRNGSGIASTQLDSAEAVQQLKSAQEMDKALGAAANSQKALISKATKAAHERFISQIDSKQKGKHPGAVSGQSALKAKPNARDLDAALAVDKLASPLVLMKADSGINWATPASAVVFAGQQLHWSTQGDLHLAASHSVAMVAANAVGLFTHSGGIQAIAGNGPLSLQAHTGQLEILADKAITVISVNDSIEIKARKKIILQAGQSSVTLEGGNITFVCPGNFTVKGGKHVFDGGGKKAAKLVKLPDTRVK